MTWARDCGCLPDTRPLGGGVDSDDNQRLLAVRGEATPRATKRLARGRIAVENDMME